MKKTATILLGGLWIFVLCSVAMAATNGPFEELLGPYHEVRTALVEDDLGGAAEHARVIEKRAKASLEEGAGGETPDWVELVEEIATAAGQLSSAGDLAAARDAFYSLSKPLSRYRKLIGDDSTIVAYCPMAKKAWLQPDGELQNPYLGQEMPTCGNRIPD